MSKRRKQSDIIDLTLEDYEDDDSSSIEEIMVKQAQPANSSSTVASSSSSTKNNTSTPPPLHHSQASRSSTIASFADQARDDLAIARALSELENVNTAHESQHSRSSRKKDARVKKRLLKSFTCNICLQDDVKYYLGYSLSACNHRFCIECLANLIKSNPPHETSKPIPCSTIDCQDHLSLLDIQYILKDEPESWRIYSSRASTASIERQVSNDANHMRRCPAERCNYVFVHDHHSIHHFDCPLCRSSFCLNCVANGGNVGPAHIGQSCIERYEQLQKEEEERVKLEQWKLENAQADERFQTMMDHERSSGMTRQCPSCKRFITKNGGCDHMRCICGIDYNWSKSR